MKKTLNLSKIFSTPKTISKKLFRKISLPRPQQNPGTPAIPALTLNFPQKPPPVTPFFRIHTTPNPAPIHAPIPQLSQSGALYAPGLGSADPLFDAILLEVFANRGPDDRFTSANDELLIGIRRKSAILRPYPEGPKQGFFSFSGALVQLKGDRPSKCCQVLPHFSDVKMGNTPGLLPRFPELLPLDREKWGNGARIMEIRDVLSKSLLYGHSAALSFAGPGYPGCPDSPNPE